MFSWIAAHIPSTAMLERLWLVVHLIFDIVFIGVIISFIVFLTIANIHEHYKIRKIDKSGKR